MARLGVSPFVYGSAGALARAVAALFAAGEQGAWYDPSDFSSMYQDSVGTTPVTAVEQPVGLLLDKRLGMVRGAELTTNGGSEVAVISTVAIQRGTVAQSSDRAYSGAFSAKYTCNDGTAGDHLISIATVPANTPVEISMWVYNPTGNFADLTLVDASDGSWNGATTTVKDAWTQIRGIRAGKATSWPIAVGHQAALSSLGFIFYFDEVTVKAIAGNHATQATAASRPTLSARYNQFLNTAFSGVAAPVAGPTGWTTSATNGLGAASTYVIQSDSTTLGFSASNTGRMFMLQQFVLQPNASYVFTADIVSATGFASDAIMQLVIVSGTLSLAVPASQAFFVSDGTGRKTITVTAGAGGCTVTARLGVGCGAAMAADGTSVVGRPSFLASSDDALSIPAYQRVNTATDYDTSGFPKYLKFDGVDDGMATGNVDFSATDKMTVWAGVYKASDAAIGAIVELSANLNVNNGAFWLIAPITPGAASLSFNSKGTVSAETSLTNAAYAAPVNWILTGQANIAADTLSLRANGAQVGTSAGDQGTGNYGNYPLYIGRRGDASLPYNGRIYQLIVRGATTIAASISDAERYVASKMGVTL